MEKVNILFTCAGRRNYLINYFKEALQGNGLVIATDMQADAPALIDADISVGLRLKPELINDQLFDFLLDIALCHPCDLRVLITSASFLDFEHTIPPSPDVM